MRNGGREVEVEVEVCGFSWQRKESIDRKVLDDERSRRSQVAKPAATNKPSRTGNREGAPG